MLVLTTLWYISSQNTIVSFLEYWFVAKNLSNFVSIPWKLSNRNNSNLYLWFPLHFGISYHGVFLEWWNTTKSLSTNWQCFSFWFDVKIAKMCKKFNSHSGFLRADQDRAKNCYRMCWIGGPILQLAQKSNVRF